MKILNLLDQISNTTIPYETGMEVDKIGGVCVYFLTPKVKVASIDHSKVRVFNSRGLLGQIKELQEVLRFEQFDIVHTHHSRTALMICILKIFGWVDSKWVHTMHSSFPNYKVWRKLIFFWACNLSDRVICNSQHTLSVLPMTIQKSSKCDVVYNGVNFAKIGFEQIKDQKFALRKKSILWVGRMVPEKNAHILIHAFARIHLALPGWEIEFCGDGLELANLKDEAKKCGVAHKIVFHGFLNREAVYAKMRSCRMLVTTSLFEGFCNVNVEALSAGLPLLTTDVGPLREVAAEAAEFFASCHVVQLSDLLLRLAGSPKLLEGMSKKGLERAPLFSLSKAGNGYHRVYQLASQAGA